MVELKKVFGEVVVKVRKEKGISQEQLALSAEIDRTFMSKMERGKNQPSLDTIFAISKALDIAPSELLCLVEEKISS
jgi:transcriptional regulator with XRE-family HTH domain